MAKKVVAPDEGREISSVKKRKKLNKCCTCCLIFLIVMLVIFGAAFGIGWYFGDKYTQEYLDMSLGDALGVLSDLYWMEDDDVVTNPYTSKDLDSFYLEIKRNILLKDDADIDFDSALAKAFENYIGANSGEYRSRANSSFGSDERGEEDDSSIMNIVADMVAEVMSRDNIDLRRLNAYDHNDPETDEYIFNLNDKQVAAFINTALKTAFKNASKIESLSDVSDMFDLSKIIALKQVLFAAQSGVNDAGETIVKATTADVTVWLGLQDAANQAMSYYLKDAGMGWASGFVGWLGDVILPENIYITLTVPLYGDAEAQINLNDMDEKEQARMYKLVNGILDLSGSDSTITDILADFTDIVKPYLEAAGDSMPLDNVNNGTITMDLLGTLAAMASEDTESEPLTKADFIYVLQALLSDPQAQLDAILPYRYQNMYTDADGNEAYVEGPVNGNLTPINYKRKFVDEIESKYALDLRLENEDDPDLSDILDKLGMSFDGEQAESSGDVLDLVDSDKFHAALDRNRADLEVIVTDRMLAALLADRLDSMLTDSGSSFEGFNVILDALTFLHKTVSGALHEYAMIAVEVDVSDMLGSLGDDKLISKLAASVMPERIALTITTDVTKSLPAGHVKDEVLFVLNDCNNTDRALAAIGKIVPELDLQSMAEKIESMLTDMLDKMYDKINVRLVASTLTLDENTRQWIGEHGGMEMPDIFALITDTALYDEDADDGHGGTGKRVIEPDELQIVLRELNDVSAFTRTSLIESDYTDFLDQVIDKYYLETSGLTEEERITNFDRLTSFVSDFDRSKFRITAEDPDPRVKYIAYDDRPINDPRENHRYDLKPFMTDKELGALLVEKMENNGNVDSYTIMDVNTAADNMIILLSIDVSTMLTEDVLFLVNTDKVYVTATVLLDELLYDEQGLPYAYDVDITVNHMDDDTYRSTLDIVEFIGEFSIDEQVKEFGKILYEQLDALNNSISGDQTDNGDLFEFTDGGLVMTDFYTFLANKTDLQLTETRTAETVKAAMQGMYRKPTVPGFPNNPNNYVLADDIMRNCPPADQQAWTSDLYLQFVRDGGTRSDIDINAMLKYGVEAWANGDVTVIQTTILKSGDDTQATAEKREQIFDWASDRIEGGLSASADYILITFEMTMNKFMDSSKNEDAVILPDMVYATVVYRMTDDADEPFERVATVFNNMDHREYEIVVAMMGLRAEADDPNVVNIETVSMKSAQVLNALAEGGTVTLGKQYDGNGIGSYTRIIN